MRKNTENLHPIVQFETLSKCLGNLWSDQPVEVDLSQQSALLERIMAQMDRLLNEMNPDEPAQRETSFKDACSIVAKRIHHIMQARSLGELAITFKHGFRGDWVIDKTKLALTLKTTQDGDEKKEKHIRFDDVDLNALLVQAEAQLLYDDPNIPAQQKQALLAMVEDKRKQTEEKKSIEESGKLRHNQQTALLATGVEEWNQWYRNSSGAADLHDVILRKRNLQGVELCDANLEGADLRRSDLQGADLRGASLCNARLQGTNLHGAIYNHYTRFPTGFDPEASGMKYCRCGYVGPRAETA